MPATPDSPEATTSDEKNAGPLVSTHRWPWRAEEFISMAISAAVILALGYFLISPRLDTISGGVALTGIAVTVLAAVAAVYYLYRVKKKRTDTSQVTITIIGTVVRSESKGPLGLSQVDVADVETVSYRRYLSDETFMISDKNKSVRIPLRATKDSNVRDMVELAFTNAKNTAGEAANLRQKMLDGDFPH